MQDDNAALPQILEQPAITGKAFQLLVSARANAEHIRRRCEPLLVTAQRQIAYFGNIELGDRVRATLRGLRDAAGGLQHVVELSRLSDNALIARGYTRRAAYEAGPAAGACA